MFDHRMFDQRRALATAILLLAMAVAALPAAGEWTHWRGPHQNGTSGEKGLISEWSKDGTNLIWRADFTGRSTPVVLDGRVCAMGRHGEGVTRQEVVACWRAEDGTQLWERRFNVYNTAVPWNRVGWGSLAADPETGNVYGQLVNGRFVALGPGGETAWEWILGEDLGRFSGYGGRTNTPVVDEDRVIAHLITAGWGKDLGPGGDRWAAFDKRTGEILWVSARGEKLQDLNTYSSPTVAVIDGQRLVIGGGADGYLRAFQARTGKEVWHYQLSKRGLNSSPVVDGHRVFAAHSEENVDSGVMGRMVALDGRGTGELGKDDELWRIDAFQAGYVSPMFHDGRLYHADNSANLVAYDAASGEELWAYNYGNVGKGSPVWADGKIFLTEVNGHVHILKPGDEGAEALDEEYLSMPEGRYAEVYGSPAIAYGRIYLTSEEGIYCLGEKSKPFRAEAGEAPRLGGEEPPAADTPAAWLQVTPAVWVGRAGETVRFTARTYDAKGRLLGEVRPDWTLSGLPGTIAADGTLKLGSDVAGTKTGTVDAELGGLSATSHLRLAGTFPWSEDFDSLEVGSLPPGWIGVARKGAVGQVEGDSSGNKVLKLEKPAAGAPRAIPLAGPSSLSGYTVQVDAQGTKTGRRRSDVGVVNSGYTLDLQGNHQRLQIRSWISELRMSQQIDFPWEPGVWYTLKLRVDVPGEKAMVRGKVWPRGEAEPEEWTLTVEDPLPIRHGAPGLYAFIPVDAYFDNFQITVSE